MKQAELFKAVRALRLTITKDDAGEYRIAVPLDQVAGRDKDRQEAGAYYTDDRDDALATAKAIRAALDA
ncbi:hypothetical protein BABAJAGA_00390 [Brevundimonas phage vB_BgoS-BabaJaga]|jgi:hypothetical protein|nr:hypothetical protein BABAJAGA_00390 [Brevundimonas phage vB_BgoS-BabaJaga]